MSYAQGEALILTQIQATANFDSNNTSQKNWKILNRGKARSYCILRAGAFSVAFFGMGGARETTYNTIAEVWTRYKDETSTNAALEARVEEIRARIDAYRLLQDSTSKVRDAVVRSGGEPLEMWTRGGNGPSWLKQELIIEWIEEEAIALQE